MPVASGVAMAPSGSKGRCPQPADLLGYTHFTTVLVAKDILAEMGDALGEGFGAQGFAAPLPSGPYTFWIQEQSAGAFEYRFDFQVAPVPLSATLMLFGAGLGCRAGLHRRRTHQPYDAIA